MNYLLTVNNEKINKRPDIKLLTGNIGTYTFSFDFDKHWDGLVKFASFTDHDQSYILQIETDTVTVPSEILEKPGVWSVGVWATNTDDDVKRISSNFIEFEVANGAYSDGLTPVAPTPDVWEQLFKNSIPTIIEGYWYLYNISESAYVNTGIRAVGEKPQKNIDYFTDADKSELVDMVEEKAIGEIEIALDLIIEIQNELIGGESV